MGSWKKFILETDMHVAVTLSADADGNLLSLTGQAIGLDTQAAHTVLAGPVSGGAAAPTMRVLVESDIPALSAYALLAGRAGGQQLDGGTAASETLTLMSTAHATKGKILFGTSGYDEVNNRLGIGTASPSFPFQVVYSLTPVGTQRAMSLVTTAAPDGSAGILYGGYFYIYVRPSADDAGNIIANSTWLTHDSGAHDLGGTLTCLQSVVKQDVAGTTIGTLRGNTMQMVVSKGSVTALDGYLSWLIGNGGDTITALTHYNILIGSLPTTLTTHKGLYIPDLGGAAVGTAIGVDIVKFTAAGTMFEIRNAGRMVQTGYLRIGAVTAPTNVTDGDLNAIRLFVGTNAAFTAGVTAAEFLGRCRIGSVDTWLDQKYITTIGNIVAPAAGDVRQYARLNADLAGATNFKTMWAKDENNFESAMAPRVRSMWPKPLIFVTATASVALPSNNTTANVALINIPAPIKINKILYNAVSGGNAANVIRIAIYSENGQQKYIDVTDAVGTSTGVRTIDITDTTLAPGNYIVLICHSTYSTAPNTITLYTYGDTTLTANIANEPDYSGTLTIAAGAAPATLADPLTLTAVAASKLPVLRFLGTVLGS